MTKMLFGIWSSWSLSMAWDINKVVLIGRLSNDVELRYTPSGVPVARFGVAVGGRPSKDGQDSVSFFTVVLWNKPAETANQYLSKGKQVAIDGRLEQRTWTAQDGSRRSIVEIVAERVEFLSPIGTNRQGNTPDADFSQKPVEVATSSSKGQDDYYDNTGFNNASLDKYDPFDEEVPF